MSNRIDSAMAEKILRGDDTDPGILQSLGLEMLSELKRCYEELEEANEVGEALWNVLENWDICMDDYSMHDLYNNLDKKYARNDEGRIVLKELYSYTKEDGWQPKEIASE